MTSRIIFLADETDALQLDVVFAELAVRGFEACRLHPDRLAFSCADGRVQATVDGAPMVAALFVGWLFEDWLAPSIALLAMLKMAGHQVINPGEILFRGQNKAFMSALLTSRGVPHGDVTLLGARATIERQALRRFPYVYKPAFAIHGGRTVLSSASGVVRATEPSTIEALAGALGNLQQPLYLQGYIERPANRDIRVWVYGFRAVCSIYKIPRSGWITNSALGLDLVHCPLTDELAEIAVKAARAVGAEIAGIDVAEAPGGGYLVFEVNTCPTFPMSGPGAEAASLMAAYLADVVLDAPSRESALAR